MSKNEEQTPPPKKPSLEGVNTTLVSIPCTPIDPKLDQLLKDAVARVEAMSPAERAEMWRKQKESWVRGEMGLGPENGTTIIDTKQRDRTVYKLSWGGGGPTQVRYFGPCHMSDACVRFSEIVTKADSDPKVNCSWVHLERLPDSIYRDGMQLIAWTKTSDERPTIEGFLNEDEAR